jgi:hypothetical protein
MKTIKTFENFNSSSADEYIKSVLSKFGLEYEENVHDDAGNLCIKAESSLNDEGKLSEFIFYIFASHPDKEHATYHITFLVDGRIEDEFSTTDLEVSIEKCISEIR